MKLAKETYPCIFSLQIFREEHKKMSTVNSFKGIKGGNQNRDMDGGNGSSFWIILLIVSCVMILLVYLFVQAQNPGTAPKPDTKTVNKGSSKMTYPKSPAEYKIISDNCKLAEEHLKYDRPVRAKEAALKVLAAGINEDDPLWSRAVAVLNKVNSLVISTDLPAPGKESYVIQKGDSLIKIASNSNMTLDLLMKCNGLDASNSVIRPGKTIKVFKGNWKVFVSKKHFKLYLYSGENLFKVYNIGIGKREKTPVGTFEIDVKRKEPAWSMDGKKIPYGAKENILGTRWMSLKPVSVSDSTLKGYGIHGTWASDEIGKENNVGCIRLDNDDINELFMIVPSHTKVIIED
jgi:LysM repeat protein